MYNDLKDLWVSVSPNSSVPIVFSPLRIWLFFFQNINHFFTNGSKVGLGWWQSLCSSIKEFCFISLFTWVTGLRSVKILFSFVLCLENIWQKHKIRKQKLYILIYQIKLYTYMHILWFMCNSHSTGKLEFCLHCFNVVVLN